MKQIDDPWGFAFMIMVFASLAILITLIAIHDPRPFILIVGFLSIWVFVYFCVRLYNWFVK